MAIIDKVQSFVEMEEASGVRANAHTTGSTWDLSEQNSVPQIAGKVGFGARMVAGNNERLFNANNLYQPSLSFGIFIWVWNIRGNGSTLRRLPSKTSASLTDRAYNAFSTGSTLTFLLWYTASQSSFDSFAVDISALHSDADPGWDLIFLGRSSDHKMLVRLNDGAVQEKAIPRTTVNGSGNGQFAISEAAGAYASGDYDQLIFCDPCPTLAEMDEAWNGGAGITYASIASAPPADPTLLTATATASTKIALAWVDNSDDEDGFKVERSDNGATGWTLIETTAANATTYTDDSLTPGVTRFYRVAATNAEGDSDYTDTASATTLIGEGTVVLTETRPTVVLTETRPTCVLTETRPTVVLTEK